MRRFAAWVLFVAGVLFAAAVFACQIYASYVVKGEPPAFLNWDNPQLSTRATTRIGVFGDTQKGIAGFAELARRSKEEGIDLAVHTGDLVSRADIGHYDLAFLYLKRHLHDVPLAITPGNHDIKNGNGLFEGRIGRRQFVLNWGPSHLVIVDNSVGPPDVAAVEQLLAPLRGPVLLFMHVPPNEAPAREFKPKPAYDGFLKMIRKYPVLYVFSGHAHGYSRVQDGGVIFISNGVGGDSESWQFDQKAHMTIVDVTGESLKAREVSIDPVFSLKANFEHVAIGHVREALRGWGTVYWAIYLLILTLLYWSLRRRRKKKEPPAPGTGRFTPAKVSEPPDVVI